MIHAEAVIDRELKRCLGQMTKGVQVVSATHGDITRAYTSHWVCQVAFEEPALLVSISPKHDTHAILVASGRCTVSVLAGDQVTEGQYFSYPGRRFRYLGDEYLAEVEGGGRTWQAVPGCIAWLGCEVLEQLRPSAAAGVDHDLFLVRAIASGEGRLREPALTYSSRQGWRIAADRAREKGTSVRDVLLARLAALGLDAGDDAPEDPDG